MRTIRIPESNSLNKQATAKTFCQHTDLKVSTYFVRYVGKLRYQILVLSKTTHIQLRPIQFATLPGLTLNYLCLKWKKLN